MSIPGTPTTIHYPVDLSESYLTLGDTVVTTVECVAEYNLQLKPKGWKLQKGGLYTTQVGVAREFYTYTVVVI